MNNSDLTTLSALFESFQTTGTVPTLPVEEVPWAQSVLVQLIVDYDSLLVYNNLIQQFPARPEIPSDFEYELQCLALLENGVENMCPAFASRLLLDPVGLMNLHFAVAEELSPYWVQKLKQSGEKLLARHGLPPQVQLLLDTGLAAK
jgi:hypothetical protein